MSLDTLNLILSHLRKFKEIPVFLMLLEVIENKGIEKEKDER